MKISVISPTDGTTFYSDFIQPLPAETSDDFAETLAQETAKVNSTGLQTVMSLSDIFQEAADTYHVDVNLLTAMAKQESNFNVDSTSSSGAQGIMQLMPATAEELGVKDAYDPYENIMGGARYISRLLQRYNGDTTLALAAYNAGSGNVAKYGGIPPFAETQNYIQKITGYMAEGVEVPSREYIRADAAKDDLARDIQTIFRNLSGDTRQSLLQTLTES